MIKDGYARELLDEAIRTVSEVLPYANLLTPIESEQVQGIGFQPDTYVLMYEPEAVKASSMNQLCDLIHQITLHIGKPCVELAVPISQLIH